MSLFNIIIFGKNINFPNTVQTIFVQYFISRFIFFFFSFFNLKNIPK